MEYKTNDGQPKWNSIGAILRDITDGYLSNIDGIEYVHESDAGPFKLQSGDDIDVDPNLLGSRLLKSISQLHGIVSKVEHNQVSADEGLYRLSKFAPIVSKLSDQYAMEDPMYAEQFNDDILRVCDAIITAARESSQTSNGRP